MIIYIRLNHNDKINLINEYHNNKIFQNIFSSISSSVLSSVISYSVSSSVSFSVVSSSVIYSIKSLNGGLFNNFISSIFYKYSSNDYKELFFILNSLYYKLLQS